jgi:tRNA G26 N,N-dimethylase Trm1
MSSQEGGPPSAQVACPMNTASAKPVPEGFSSVSEGSASIIHETGHVFYNPAQVQNRDLSIACLNVFSKIYRLEKEARAAKRSSRHAADGSATTRSTPAVVAGKVAPEEIAVEYKGLRILEGMFLPLIIAWLWTH